MNLLLRKKADEFPNLLKTYQCSHFKTLFKVTIKNVKPHFFQPPTLHQTDYKLKEKASVFKFIFTNLIQWPGNVKR